MTGCEFVNKNIFKKWWFWAIVALCLLILVPLTINFLFRNHFGVEWFVAEWTAGEALSYVGTILGAGATICAVVLTISYSRERQFKTFRMELERERRENWLAEAKKVFEYAINDLNDIFFVQNIIGLSPENMAEKTNEIRNEEILIIKLYGMFSLIFKISPLKDSSAINEQVFEKVDNAIEAWRNLAQSTQNTYECFSIQPFPEDEFVKKRKTLDLETTNYRKNFYYPMKDFLISSFKQLKILADEEYKDMI